jgi:acylphosphatase
VGFRYSTVNQARRGNLTGYVRNLPDGSVEVIAEGQASNLKALLSWLEHGPPGAVVRRVEHRFTAFGGTYRNFSVEF